MTKRINIRIFPDGQIQAEIKGIKGKKCTDYIGILETLLRSETVDSDLSAEYYESEVQVQEVETSQQRIKR